MTATQLTSRAEALKALYQHRREDLKPTLRAWCKAVECGILEMSETRKIKSDVERGAKYLDTVIGMLSIAEACLTVFTVAELQELKDKGLLLQQ